MAAASARPPASLLARPLAALSTRAAKATSNLDKTPLSDESGVFLCEVTMVHQYKLNGYNIVLDTCSGSVHTVDEVAYDVIEMYKTHTEGEIVEALLAKHADKPDVTREELLDILGFNGLDSAHDYTLRFWWFYRHIAYI